MKYKLLIALCIVTGLLGISVRAESTEFVPYYGYEYNSYDESVPVPEGYIPEKVYSYREWGLETPLQTPTDFCYDDQGSLYVLDAGNSRVIVLDAELKLKKTIDSFVFEGEVLTFSEAGGIFAAGDRIYIADTSGCRVLISDLSGNVQSIITRPDSVLLSENFEFKAQKVLVDSANNIYVVAEGSTEGILVFDAQYQFQRFYGTNTVTRTAEVIKSFFLRKFLTKEQIRRSTRYTPAPVANFDIGKDGMVYTVTNADQSKGLNFRGLNYKGNNIVSAENRQYYGDTEWDRLIRNSVNTRLVDVTVDSDGVFYLLDAARGRVFCYTEEGWLVSVFGGLDGSLKGTFVSPAAVETIGEKVLVLDDQAATITSFTPNVYARTVKQAMLEYAKGNYEESFTLWQKVLDQNSFNEWAHLGIAKVYEEQGNYSEAMHHYRLGVAQGSYSNAMRSLREEYVNDHFLMIVLCIAGAIALIAVSVTLIRKRLRRFVAENGYSAMEKPALFPFYSLAHPIDAFEQFRSHGKARYTAGIVVLAFWLVAYVIRFFGTAFHFNGSRAVDFNLFSALAGTIGLFMVFVVANWAVTTLMDGKGTFKSIFCVSAYGMIPYCVSLLCTTALSYVLTRQDAVFLEIVLYVGLAWSAVVVFVGLMTIHQYTVGKTIAALLITVIGIVIIFFIMILLSGLFSQIVSFAQSVYEEISIRL